MLIDALRRCRIRPAPGDVALNSVDGFYTVVGTTVVIC